MNKTIRPNKFIYLTGILILFVGIGSCNSQDKNTLPVQEFDSLLNRSADKQLVDVRTPGEFNDGHLKEALNIDFNGPDFKTEINKLDKNKPVFVYCLKGGRSASAAAEMREAGFVKVFEMKGGITEWKNAKLPVVVDLHK
jgi:thioredoxin 1